MWPRSSILIKWLEAICQCIIANLYISLNGRVSVFVAANVQNQFTFVRVNLA